MNKPTILDFRPQLRERLASIDAELMDLTRHRERLVTLRSSIEATLNHEDAVHGDGDPMALAPALHPTQSGMGLADLLLRLLEAGPKTLDQLKRAGGGWPLLKDHSSPGRAINFALVGLQKGGHVIRNTEEGTWQLVSGDNRK